MNSLLMNPLLKSLKQSQKLLLTGLFIASIATAQDADRFKDVVIETTKLTDNIYMLVGAGGNIGVSAGEEGVFIIDDQFAPLTDKITAAIKEISDKPVKFVINTHWHGDHSGGNENFGKAGSVIMAHDNVHRRMSTDQFIARFDAEVPAAPKVAQPVVTFNDELGLHLNGDNVRAHHISHAHTDGDSIIHFPESNVIHMGDTFFNGGYPFIDISSGGNVKGVIKAAKKALQLANDDTQIIPGHGALSNKQGLQAYHDMLIQVRDLVKAEIDAGKSLEEATAAKPTATLDEQWGQGFINADAIVAFVYESLTQ